MAGAIILAAAVLTASLTSADHVALERRELRLGDIAEVHGPGAAEIAKVVVARLPDGETRTLSRHQIAGLVRRAIPAIRIDGPLEGMVSIETKTEIPVLTPPACFEATAAIAPNQPITSKDVRAVECSSVRTTAAIALDPNNGLAAASVPIRIGDYLGRLLLTEAPSISRGDKLTLVSKDGPVTILRQVTALQDAGPHQHRLFVRTGDGAVFSAPLAAGAAQ